MVKIGRAGLNAFDPATPTRESAVPGRLEGKVVVITGTGIGMARQVALRCVAEGASVIGCDILGEDAQETLDIVRAAGGRMESLHPIDLTNEQHAHHLLEFAADTFGGVDVVHHNAMQMRLGAVEDSSLDDWQFTIDHTLLIPFLVSKHAIPHLRARGGGSMSYMGSVAGANLGTGYPGNLPLHPAYSVAKAGVIRLASYLAHELAPWNIRTNTISPGCVATPRGLNFYGAEGTADRQVVMNAQLTKRLGEPDDIASAVVYLASDEASWINGLNLAIDGGHHASGGAGTADPEDVAVYAPKMKAWSTVDHWETSGKRA
ncbi:SDR family oxidoreductase [Pseudonocardia kujensis]|uniref:SDR family NAD(P)-dependent oxidoreductase n=1 Tax=Pseudonocardia kujensis TaxID=1128675 RepID=UPI001E4F1B65|nr:SDR family oxidoreductase [Pseudonocardia kujensis]MCE0765564.1 SDR family oxidoreductase [Pseudonocardia kujensis]